MNTPVGSSSSPAAPEAADADDAGAMVVACERPCAWVVTEVALDPLETIDDGVLEVTVLLTADSGLIGRDDREPDDDSPLPLICSPPGAGGPSASLVNGLGSLARNWYISFGLSRSR